jgi:hypothetical protein
MTLKYGTQNCNRNSKDDYEVHEFKREKLEKFLPILRAIIIRIPETMKEILQ